MPMHYTQMKVSTNIIMAIATNITEINTFFLSLVDHLNLIYTSLVQLSKSKSIR